MTIFAEGARKGGGISGLTQRERMTIEAVAGHFSAKWKEGEDQAAGHLAIAGKRIAIRIAMIKKSGDGAVSGNPRLRFDKVARGLLGHLQTALRDVVPDDRAVIVTVTAPIRLPAKTADALEKRIRDSFARGAARVDIEDTIHENAIRIRIVRSDPAQTSKVIGFVHNPGPHADDILLDSTEALLAFRGAPADKQREPERWLIITNENAFPSVGTWRQICSQLSLPCVFKKIALMSADGRVESLTG
jgi:hypothetical protein